MSASTEPRGGATDPASVSIEFPLDCEDDWPPVSLECLPFRPVPGGYALLAPPMFVKDLSIDDILEIDLAGRRATAWRHRSRSGHTTMWMMELRTTGALDAIMVRLRELGCHPVHLPACGTYSVDIPSTIPITAVDAILADLDPDTVAVAFPSMRHEDRGIDQRHP